MIIASIEGYPPQILLRPRTAMDPAPSPARTEPNPVHNAVEAGILVLLAIRSVATTMSRIPPNHHPRECEVRRRLLFHAWLVQLYVP